MGTGGPDPPEKSQNYRVRSNTGPDHLKNHKATMPAFNNGAASARQQSNIYMAFSWRANNGPIIMVFGSYLTSSSKKTHKNIVKIRPL